MDLPWHNIFIEIKDLDGEPVRFQAIQIETRRKNDQGVETISPPFAEQSYDPEKNGIYSLQYKLLNPKAAVWLVLIADGVPTAKPIVEGVHRYRFWIEVEAAKRRSKLTPEPPGPSQIVVQYVYKIANVENFFANVRSLEMAKAEYNIEGDNSSIIGERASLSGSLNRDSQVSLGPAVEDALKKASDVAKKAKSDDGRKAIQALKREAKKKAPDKPKMQGIWSGVVKAVPAVATELGKSAVDAITGLFS
jgi:hypothetical protein